MSKRILEISGLVVLLTLAGCAEQEGQQQQASTISAAAVSEIPISTSSDMALAHFEEGQALADNGRGLEARAAYLRAVEADPTFARAYLGVANTANSAAEFKEYLDLAIANAENASDGERILMEINMAFFENNVDGALALATELVEKYPASPRAILNLAGVYTNLQRIEEARETIQRAIELDPSFPLAHANLGFSYLFNDPKDFDLAAASFQGVVELLPDEPQPQVNLGDAYRGGQDLEAARDAYGRAAELDPENEKAIYSIALLKKGHVNSFLGNYVEARADYDRALAVAKPQQHSFYANYRAFTWVHQGEPQNAIDELERIADSAAETTPPDQVNAAKTFAFTNMAQIAMHHGMHDVAEHAVQQRNQLALETAMTTGDEDFIRVTRANNAYWEGVAAARRGDFDMATSKADENARLLEPDANPRKLEPYHDLLGLAALLQGDYQGAIEHYEQANPNNIYTRYHLGLAHDGAGHASQAEEIFQYVFENNFNSIGYALVRSEAEQRLSRS